MAVLDTDIKLKLSTKSGAAGNSLASTPADSLGKYISTTEVVTNILHNLFDLVTGIENKELDVEYRCIFIHNAHATDALLTARTYISSQAAGGADITMGLDPTAISAVGAAADQALSILNEDTAPAGVVFSTPSSAAPLVIGDLAAGMCKAVWFKRKVNNTIALQNDSSTLIVQGETL